MRIAQISYHACPLSHEEGKETGGCQVYVLNLSRELAKMGHEVDIFTRSENPDPKLKVVEIEKNLRLFHLPAGPEKTLPKRELIQYVPEFSRNFLSFVGADPCVRPYDLFHAHYYMSGLAVSNLLQTTDLRRGGSRPAHSPAAGGTMERSRPFPTIINFHTIALIKNLVARGNETEPETRVNAEMELAKNADAIISPSYTERDYLNFFYGAARRKIHIIPPGFDPALFKPMDRVEARKKIGADPTHKIILFVGRIEPLKGIDVLMYALKVLTERCNKCPVCLWIVGGENNIRVDPLAIRVNPEQEKLRQLQQTLKLQNYIKFTGQLAQSDLPFYYNAADVVVMPSHYESFGMSALEAMACGTPVVTTNVTGISTMFDERQNHFVISASNPLQLAKTIEKIVGGDLAVPAHADRPACPPVLRHRRCRRGGLSLRINDFTWSKTAEKMVKVYEELPSSTPQ